MTEMEEPQASEPDTQSPTVSDWGAPEFDAGDEGDTLVVDVEGFEGPLDLQVEFHLPPDRGSDSRENGSVGLVAQPSQAIPCHRLIAGAALVNHVPRSGTPPVKPRRCPGPLARIPRRSTRSVPLPFASPRVVRAGTPFRRRMT